MLRNVMMTILSSVLAGWEGTGVGGIPRVFKFSPALGTGGFGAATAAPACWGTSGPGKESEFLHLGSLSTSVGCLGIYRLGP